MELHAIFSLFVIIYEYCSAFRMSNQFAILNSSSGAVRGFCSCHPKVYVNLLHSVIHFDSYLFGVFLALLNHAYLCTATFGNHFHANRHQLCPNIHRL